MNEEALREAFHYLKAVQRDFPGGIPRSLIVETNVEMAPDQSKEVRAHFVLSTELEWGTQEGILLKGAIESGLKLNLSACAFSHVGKNSNQDSIVQEVQSSLAKVVIVCGCKAAVVLGITGKSIAEMRKVDHQLNGAPVIVTVALNDVVADSSLKRDLWNDLKRALPLLNKDLK